MFRDTSLSLFIDRAPDTVSIGVWGNYHALSLDSNAQREELEMSSMIIRVSVIRCDPSQFERLRAMMVEVEAALRPGIEAMPGFLAFYAGEDAALSAFINTSFWETLEQAQQLDRFQPMLEAGKQFVAAGARFDRPIMNHTVLWEFGNARIRREAPSGGT